MKRYDWIVVGAGITGAALGYELAKQGCSVLLIEQEAVPQSATRYSYGGIAYWAGTTELTRTLYAEGIQIYRSLSAELEAEIQLRELDLLLTIPPDRDPQQAAQACATFAIPPYLLSVQAACELEPLLNSRAISGALTVKHGHVDTQATAAAYIQAMIRLGGAVHNAQVTGFQRGAGQRVIGVTCGSNVYSGNHVIVCAGGWSRSLLQASGIPVRLYFTHTEIIETPPVEISLRTLVMPAETTRFQLESAASTADRDELWNQPGQEPVPAILDVGAVQFLDGSIRIGQISRTLTDPKALIDEAESEAKLRAGIGEILPALQDLPGTWRHTLVAFSCDKQPLIGAIPSEEGVSLFSGLSNPLAIVPALARRFARHLTGQPDSLIPQFSPERFGRSRSSSPSGTKA